MSTSGAQLRVAVTGAWHVHAVDYARELQAAGIEIAGVWDEDDERAGELAAILGVPTIATLDRVIDDRTVDGVVVTDAPSRKASTVRAALQAGKHVITEKLLAASEADARDLASLARAGGLALMTALPFLSRGPVRTIHSFLADGRLGRITYARVRLAIDGRSAGWLPARFDDPDEALVGVMGDLGCHPIYLVARILGDEVSAVSATYASSSGAVLEDNAVVAFRSTSGAIGVAESSHVAAPGLAEFVIEVAGTAGVLSHGVLDDQHVYLKTPGSTWSPLPPVPAGQPPTEQWVEAIRSGATLKDNARQSVRLTRWVARATAASNSPEPVFPRD